VIGHLKINRAVATRYDQLADATARNRALLDQTCPRRLEGNCTGDCVNVNAFGEDGSRPTRADHYSYH
jgi:hypothetical protein